MAKRVKFNESGDSDELQALFESTQKAAKKPRLEVVGETEAKGDSDDLQALFDSVAARSAAQPSTPPSRGKRKSAATPEGAATKGQAGPKAEHSCDAVSNRIGHMTRKPHDTLRELGYDRVLEETAKAVPDARQRLLYIAQMTEQAASRVLNATDIAKPIQEALQGEAQSLGARW
jgi:chemotaxis protein CheZ